MLCFLSETQQSIPTRHALYTLLETCKNIKLERQILIFSFLFSFFSPLILDFFIQGLIESKMSYFSSLEMQSDVLSSNCKRPLDTGAGPCESAWLQEHSQNTQRKSTSRERLLSYGPKRPCVDYYHVISTQPLH